MVLCGEKNPISIHIIFELLCVGAEKKINTLMIFSFGGGCGVNKYLICLSLTTVYD